MAKGDFRKQLKQREINKAKRIKETKEKKSLFDFRYAEIIKALEYDGLQFANVKILRKGMENLTTLLTDTGKATEVRYC